MKKSFKAHILLLLIIAHLSLVTSNDAPGLDEAPLVDEVNKGKDLFDRVSKNETEGEYLAREWTEAISKTRAGDFIEKYLNPVLKFLFGMEFTLSWKFVASFLLWTLFVATFYPIATSLFHSLLANIGITLAFTSILMNTLSEEILDFASGLIENIWHNLTFLITLIFLIVIVNRFVKAIIKSLKKLAEKRKIQKLEAEAQENKEMREGVNNYMQGTEAMKKGSEEL